MGQVTVAHAASPAPQPLRFKDEVFLRDRISTASQSLARLLLGRKALLTVRELSELQLTDQAGNSIVQLLWGKVAIGVARQRMRPGEIVEIRTENAIAAIRGTVVVAETLTPPGAAIPVSRVHVLSGYIDVTTPANPGAPPVRLVAPSSVTVTGNSIGAPVRLDVITRAALLSDLRPNHPQHIDVLAALAPGEQTRAGALGQIITGDGTGGSETVDPQDQSANPADATNPVGQAPITPFVSSSGVGAAGVGSGLPFTYTNQVVNIRGDFYQVPAASNSNLSTDLLRSTNSTLTIGGDVLQVNGSLGSGTALPFISVNGGTLAAQTATRLLNGTLGLSGPLLNAVNASLALTGPALLDAQANSQLTATGLSPLVSLTGGSLALGAGTSGLSLNSNSAATLSGPFFAATGTATAGSSDFVAIKSSTLTDATTSALVNLTGGTFQLGGAAAGFSVSNNGTASLTGGLLSATGTAVTSTADFVLATTNGRFIVAGPAAPLVSLTGGVSQIASTGSIFHLVGSGTSVDPVSGLLVGTDEPIQTGGGFLDMDGATVTTQRAVTVDVALLQATAPLLNLRGGAQLTTNGNAIDLTSKAKITNSGPYVALDASRIIVNAGALVNVAGGSFLQTGGNLINLANGSTLTINNGVLLFVSGGSIVNISGALIAFSGGGNVVNVSNALPFTNINGIPVALTGGALASNVSITGTPIKNQGLGVITPNKALIQVNGANSKLTISGN
jgi:FecR protein